MKIEAKQINEWIERAYGNAVKHGWHEKKNEDSHSLMMIITEVSEAVQADRNGRWMDDLDKSGLECTLANDHHGGLFENFYKRNIEGKVESELADICIRMFDFMGEHKIELIDGIDTGLHYLTFNETTFTRVAFVITDYIICVAGLPNKKATIDECVDVLTRVFAWAEYLGIDLVQHINLKMRYNESREYRHGNKLY